MKKSFFLLAVLFVSLSGHSQTLLRQQVPVTGNPDPFDEHTVCHNRSCFRWPKHIVVNNWHDLFDLKAP